MVLFNKLELEIRDAGIGGNVRQVSHWGPPIGERDNVGNGLRIKGNIDGLILHCQATTPQETSSTLETDTPKTNSNNNDTVLDVKDAEETTSTLPPVTDTPETHSDRKYV